MDFGKFNIHLEQAFNTQGSQVIINNRQYQAHIEYCAVEPTDNYAVLDHKGQFHLAVVYLERPDKLEIIPNVTQILVEDKLYKILSKQEIDNKITEIIFA